MDLPPSVDPRDAGQQLETFNVEEESAGKPSPEQVSLGQLTKRSHCKGRIPQDALIDRAKTVSPHKVGWVTFYCFLTLKVILAIAILKSRCGFAVYQEDSFSLQLSEIAVDDSDYSYRSVERGIEPAKCLSDSWSSVIRQVRPTVVITQPNIPKILNESLSEGGISLAWVSVLSC